MGDTHHDPIGVAVTVLPGIATQPLLDLANQAGQFIR
jgi:hypothetical protein